MDESKQKLLILVLALVSVVLVATNVIFYRKLNSAKNPQAQAQEDVQSLVSEVGKLMLLPDEAPTVATVTDPAQLQGQPFFVNAKTGDKVLIYAAARKAVLYSPSEKRIVEVAPLIIGEVPTTNTPAPETPATGTPAAQ